MASYQRTPDASGEAGQAWKMKRPEGHPPSWKMCLVQWVVNRPGAHPFWEHWIVGVISLADEPGVEPAIKHYPGATHEFCIFALDPKAPLPEIDGDINGERGTPLMPLDVVIQFDGLEDEQAVELAHLAVKAIVNGQLSPDQDYRRLWHTAVQQTVHHLKSGHHGEELN